MASYINIVDIPAQESTNDLAKAFASAFAKAINWKLDTDGITVWATAEKNLGVRFFPNGTYASPIIVNAVRTSGTFSSSDATFVKNSVYKLYWAKTAAGTVALGVGSGDTISPSLSVVLGKNDKGILSALHSVGNGQGTPPTAILTTAQSNPVYFKMSTNYGDTMPLSLVRLPDMANGGMFGDIYIVLSTPVNTPSTLFYVDGRYYRPIRINDTSTTTTTLAIPVG